MTVKTFKTAKGTEIPILNLRGKDYLQVAWRLVWFREEKPDWSIVTTPVELTPTSALFRTEILDEKGRVISIAHKYEDKQGFQDFREKSETGSVGRALAHCGYGTQFTGDELDEGHRIVDTPLEKPPQRAAPTPPPPVFQELDIMQVPIQTHSQADWEKKILTNSQISTLKGLFDQLKYSEDEKKERLKPHKVVMIQALSAGSASNLIKELLSELKGKK